MRISSRNKGTIIPYLFILPSLIGVCAIMIFPYVDVLIRSFKNVKGNFTGFSNYMEVFVNEAFITAMANTGKFMGVCIPIMLVISLALALIIFEIPKASSFIKTGLLLPMVVPVASVVLVWKYFFSQTGFINGYLLETGGTPVNWMESSAAFWILIAGYIWRNLGFNVILWLAALSAVNYSSQEAAKLEGAGFFRRHLCITLPAIHNMSFVIIVLAMLNSFKVFREAYMVCGDYPDNSIYMIQHLFNNWFRNLDIDRLAAASVIDGFVMVVLIAVLQYAWGSDQR